MCFNMAGATPRSHRHETLHSRCARIAKPRNAQFLIHPLLPSLLLLLRWLTMLLGCLRFFVLLVGLHLGWRVGG